MTSWNFPSRIQKKVLEVLSEWYASHTLNSIRCEWEKKTNPSSSQNVPLNILSYNVEGWGTRSLEVTDLIFKVDSSICVFTEVGLLWDSFKVPHFNSFYQKGTNKNGGVMIAIGKHLKATRIEVNIDNTVIVDVTGLTEPVRIIGIYWAHDQVRDMKDLDPFIIKNTIISGDFNATVQEWGSPSTDTRGRKLKSWTEDNNLQFVPTTINSSKRSERNIDLTFTNVNGVDSATVIFGTSDHWPAVVTTHNIGFLTNKFFPQVNWNIFQVLLVLVEDFWINKQKLQTPDQWYENYIRFLAALKNRLTTWREIEKYRPALPDVIVKELQQIRRVRNQYYRERKARGVGNDETRVLLREMTRDVRKEISKYKAARWNDFLSTIQGSHDKREKMFWSHLGKIYKAKTLPFSKLMVGNKALSDEQEIIDALFMYSAEQSKAPKVDKKNQQDVQVALEHKTIKDLLRTSKDLELEATSVAEVKILIKKMKGKKSSGFDEISNLMIKMLPPTYIQCLVKCFNIWLKECRYPKIWKTAKVITLNKLKAGVPRCDQTRPISLLSTHSKLFEKILLERVRLWAEGNKLVPQEQSGFRSKCLLQTRALSMFQEVKNNLAANAPTLAIYVDYEKAYDRVWHMGLMVKFFRLGIPVSLLKMLESWLADRTAHLSFGSKKSEPIKVRIGLPQGSSLSPFLFVVYHCDIVKCFGAHPGHLFADDLCVLIRPPLQKSLKDLINDLEIEGTKVCTNITQYSKQWKQPLNINKCVGQVFHSQIRRPIVNVFMAGQRLEIVRSFKYLGYTWTDKLSLHATVNTCLEKTQTALNKLKWLRSGRTLTKEVLRRCFFAYVFPHLAWIFPFFPLLPKTQQESLRRKHRVAIRLIHRAPFVSEKDLFALTGEVPLNSYVKRYIEKRLKNLYSTDLGTSLFLEDIFFWDTFNREGVVGIGHYSSMKRVKNMKIRHQSQLLLWLDFLSKSDS